MITFITFVGDAVVSISKFSTKFEDFTTHINRN